MKAFFEVNETTRVESARMGAAKRLRGGNVLSASLGLLLACQIGAASAATVSEQIHHALRQHLQPSLERDARQLGWQQPRLTLDLNLPASAAQLPACSQALQVHTLSGRQELLARQRFRVSCPQPQWSQDVTAQAKVSVLLLVASRLVDRDQALEAADMKLERQELARHDRSFFGKAEQVIGQTAKRRIRAGQRLTAELLAAPLWVRRGQSVSIIARHDGIEASTAGEALAHGREGEIMRVRNRSSEKVIEAQVIGEGVVTSTWR